MENENSLDIVEIDSVEFDSTCIFDMCANGG
ncbi:hypothetical protein ATHSA_1291 [Athalassotoga saccharophila]|nr:hypothetical protein ATHSA_1291 [Athalassotoga saccharophila]